VVERVQEVTAIALAKGDNSLALAKARSLRSRLAYDELVALRDKLLLQYKDELPDPIETQVDDLVGCYEQLVPEHLREFLLDKEEASDQMEREAGVRKQADERIDERDEFAALEEAAPELIRLDRYERRAWSRQKRAIRDFMNMKWMRAIEHQPTASMNLLATGGRPLHVE
jgi:hypothetical protein